MADEVNRGGQIGHLSMGGQPYVWVRMGAYVTRWVPAGVLLGPSQGDTCSAPVPPVPPHATRAPHWLPGRMVPVFPVPVHSLFPSSRYPPWPL